MPGGGAVHCRPSRDLNVRGDAPAGKPVLLCSVPEEHNNGAYCHHRAWYSHRRTHSETACTHTNKESPEGDKADIRCIIDCHGGTAFARFDGSLSRTHGTCRER